MTVKLTFALATVVGAAAVAAGCGNDVPSGSVAKVGDTTIEKSEFDKWLKTATSSQQQAGGAAPDPPDFEKCTKAVTEQPAPEGAEKLTEKQARKQCEDQYDQIKNEVMQFLIQSEWVQQEAEEQGIEVSDAEVKRALEDQKKAAFPKEKDYEEFLRTSGMTEEDVLFRVRLNELQEKLTQKVTEDEGKVSDAEVEEYYEKNKERFAQPERRDLNVVLTKTEEKADEAHDALQDGDSFKQVSKEFSIDEASKAQGGKLPAVAQGQQEQALDQAVFSADKGDLEGPVKTQFGWYVFEVSKITPASQQSLEDATETIKNLLKSQKQQQALEKFIKEFQEEYKDKTDCADDFVISECGNSDEETDTGPASGGDPQAPQPQTGAPPTTGAPPPSGAPPAAGAPQAPPPAPAPAPPQP